MRMRKMRVMFGFCVATSLVSCGGSSVQSQPTAQSTWQLVLTVKTATLDLGITGIALDGKGNLFAAEFDDSKIYKYSTAGKLLATWGEHGTGPGQLEAPDKLAFDTQGNLYVTEVGSRATGEGQNNRVQKFSPDGTSLARWGTFGSGPGQFNSPVGIAIDKQGDIYVADIGNHRVVELSSQGQPLAEWHTVGSGSGESTEIGYDLALDAGGNVYVTEPHPFSTGSDNVQKFSPSGGLLATWGGTGFGAGQFHQPTGVAVDSKGDVFVVDAENNRVEKFSSSGKYLAQWKGPDPPFKFVSKVAVDDHGNLYASNGTQVLKLAIG
jgi:tripartite motif-containing protein 71